MNNVLKIVLGLSAGMFLLGAGSILMKNKKQNRLNHIFNNLQNENICTKTKLRRIAKELTRDINEIEKRLSQQNRKILQKEYETMKWELN